MFGRKKKAKATVGALCPYCGHDNPLGAEKCEQCYYALDKSARDQPTAEPSASNEEIMSLLLGENEEEDAPKVVEAVLSMDDVTVDVGQYDPTPVEHDGKGEPVPESFDFIGSQGPTLSSTIASKEAEEVELTADDAPKEYVDFDLGSVDPLAEVKEPVHTGRGGLYSPTVEMPKDDDLVGVLGPSTQTTPDLPDLPDDKPLPTASLASAVAAEASVQASPVSVPMSRAETATASPVSNASVSTPDLPELPSENKTVGTDEPAVASMTGHQPAAQAVPEETSSQTTAEHRIWPWPKGEPWTAQDVYREVVRAMEHIKSGQMEAAANTLDTLGPHLDKNLDMLLHVSVLMQHLGRNEHMKWTLDMAAYVHPQDPHVQQARAQLLR